MRKRMMRKGYLVVFLAVFVLLAFRTAPAMAAKSALLQKHEAEMAAYDAQMVGLKAKTAEAVKATAAAYARQDKLMAPLKMTICLPFTTVVAGAKGLINPTKSPLEYLVVPSICRGVNTAKNHVIQTLGGGVADIITAPFESQKTTFAPKLGEVGVLGQRTIERGPIAQVLEAAASAVPAACVAAGVLAPIAGVSYGGTVAILGTTVPVAAMAVGEAAGMAEKAVLK